MSLKENDVWLDEAYENFREALDTGNFDLATDIAKDVKDKGFDSEFASMALEIEEEKVKDIDEDPTDAYKESTEHYA